MKLVTAYSSRDPMEADIVHQLLRRARIFAVLRGDADIVNGQPMPGVLTGEDVQVLVREQDLPAVQEIVADFTSGAFREQLKVAGDWKCPKCGEEIEAQFTDCWSCGTARPQPDAPPERDKPMTIRDVGFDLPCMQCGYNLRGLSSIGRCPECGTLIIRTLLNEREVASTERFGDVLELMAAPIDRAVSTGLSQSAVWFLLEAWPHALAEVTPPVIPSKSDEHLRKTDALELSRAVAAFAIEYFGDARDAAFHLRRWGFARATDLARGLFALIKFELLDPIDRVTLADFPDVEIDALFPPSRG